MDKSYNDLLVDATSLANRCLMEKRKAESILPTHANGERWNGEMPFRVSQSGGIDQATHVMFRNDGEVNCRFVGAIVAPFSETYPTRDEAEKAVQDAE